MGRGEKKNDNGGLGLGKAYIPWALAIDSREIGGCCEHNRIGGFGALAARGFESMSLAIESGRDLCAFGKRHRFNLF